MRRDSILALLGLMLVVVGVALVSLPSVVAQEETPEPTYLDSYHEAWSSSGHADTTAEAFNRWNEDGEVEVDCAKCHSTGGYLDFLGEDGTAFGVVDNPAPIGTTVNCDACHNETASNLTEVTFPSGAVIHTDDNAARCMECHQGRASGVRVADAVSALADLNTPSEDLRFINIHYYAAAATLYGSDAGGGYQFEGQVYQMQNEHVPGYDTCTSCHNPHTLEINITDCAGCHEVETVEDLREIRMPGSEVDFDGDGDNEEGLSHEIEGMQEATLMAIQTYARDVAGRPIVYNPDQYPYWFADADDNGTIDGEEGNYDAWTGNLVIAAYNYQVTLKDPGNFAHNAVYHIQLLFDTIEMLNAQLGAPAVDMEAMHRNEAGHFDVTAQAFRNWDEDGEVSGTCARCHTAEGLPFFLDNGVSIAREPSNSLACSTCHDSLSEFTLHVVDEVTFPSGATVSFGEGEESNVCLNCHQGRESTTSVNNAIARAGVGDDEIGEGLSFRNIHYFAAGATLFGTEVKGVYEYEGQSYNGQFFHERRVDTCQGCHSVHTLENRLSVCADCHEDVETAEDVRLIRMEAEDVAAVDYDGDGDTTEPVLEELHSFQDALYAAIVTYAAETAGSPIVYSPSAYPYWFNDTNGNGEADPDEANRENAYASWTPRLLRAAYNYQYALKDPGAFAHNADYVLQVLYDSISDIGGAEAVASFTRPPVVVAEAE